MSEKEIFDLLTRFVQNGCTPEEVNKINMLFRDPLFNGYILRFLDQYWNRMQEQEANTNRPSAAQQRKMYNNIMASTENDLPERIRPELVRPSTRIRSWYFSAAAAAILVLIATAYFTKSAAPENSPVIVAVPSGNDVAAPAISKAYIQTEGKEIISLQDINSGKANALIVKEKDKLLIDYVSARSNSKSTSKVQVLTNPRGSKKVDIRLSDGTMITLNAGSSIRYPSAFLSLKREVELIGEAYFEVAKDKAHPFAVHTTSGDVLVLGTHFNVSTSGVNKSMQVTLLEGSVRVIQDKQEMILKPGEQANVAEKIEVNHTAETAQVIAWVNEEFNFKGMEIREIMQEIERWYDVEVSCADNVPIMRLSGILSRNQSLRKVMEIISISSGIQFTINDKKIYVKAG